MTRVNTVPHLPQDNPKPMYARSSSDYTISPRKDDLYGHQGQMGTIKPQAERTLNTRGACICVLMVTFSCLGFSVYHHEDSKSYTDSYVDVAPQPAPQKQKPTIELVTVTNKITTLGDPKTANQSKDDSEKHSFRSPYGTALPRKSTSTKKLLSATSPMSTSASFHSFSPLNPFKYNSDDVSVV